MGSNPAAPTMLASLTPRPFMQLSLLYTTFPTHEDALRITRELLQNRLIACGNILGPITSLYMWEGEQKEAQEIAVLLKTTSQKIATLIETLFALHPYDVPAILEIPVSNCPSSFSQWVFSEVED